MRRFLLAVAALMSACGTTSPETNAIASPADEPRQSAKQGLPNEEPLSVEDLRERAERSWTHRDSRDALLKAIDNWETLIAREPTDTEVRTRLARAYYLLADAFLAPLGKQVESRAAHDRGLGHAEQAMNALAPELASALSDGKDLQDALQTVPGDGQASLYWYAANLSKLAESSDTTRAIYTERIEAVMQRVLELDETFLGAAPHRYLGALYARAPEYLGGDLDKAKRHFDKALTIAPNFFDTKVLYAECYATKLEDKELFEELLEDVTNTDPGVIPHLMPEQRLAQQRAQRLLERLEQMF